eukprot:sb/3466197/
MEAVSRTAKTPPRTPKNITEAVEHFKNLKADHIPIGIIQTLNLVGSKTSPTTGKPILKTVKVPIANGRQATQAVVPRPDNAWNYVKQRESLGHLTDQTPCFCGAGSRDVSFLYDAKVVADRTRPLTTLTKAAEGGKHEVKFGDTKTPGIEEDFDWAAESLIPEEYHVVRVSGVHGLNIKDAPNTTLTEEHEHHVTIFPSLKPNSRKEVIQLMETMDQLLADAGCTQKDIKQVETTEIHNLLELVKKEQHIYNVVFHELIRQVCQERNLKTARRLQLCEQSWNKLAGHFGLILADVDSKALQELQNNVDHWRNKIGAFSNEMETTDDSMREKLEKILEEVDYWKDDLNIRIR